MAILIFNSTVLGGGILFKNTVLILYIIRASPRLSVKAKSRKLRALNAVDILPSPSSGTLSLSRLTSVSCARRTAKTNPSPMPLPWTSRIPAIGDA
ncbi:hypothetical protein GYMLUDRAFT_951952 [Collybiopsis luxurians FD-317 M1]|nr:hypothetical protein GYMLUDRAFT_951952 [Collybiopsis luxurians FD-317 M1]